MARPAAARRSSWDRGQDAERALWSRRCTVSVRPVRRDAGAGARRRGPRARRGRPARGRLAAAARRRAVRDQGRRRRRQPRTAGGERRQQHPDVGRRQPRHAARPGAAAGTHRDRGLLARARAARLRLRGSRAGGRAVRARARGHPPLQGSSRRARVVDRQRDGRLRRRRQPRHLGRGREPRRPRAPPRSRASDHDRDRRHRRQARGLRAPVLPEHRHPWHQQLRGRRVAARALSQGGRHQALRRDRVRSAGHLGGRAQCVGRGRGVVEHAQGRLLPRHLRAARGGLGGLPGFVRVHVGRQAGGDRDLVRHAAARRLAPGRRRRDGRAVVGTRAGRSLPGDRFTRARGRRRSEAGSHRAGEARGERSRGRPARPSSGRCGETRSPTRPAETTGRRRAATASRS